MSKHEEVKEAREVRESEAKKAFKVLIERYAEQNPIKYELKKEELAKKLAKL